MNQDVHIDTWYLAGPMSGIDGQNYPAFQDACERIRNMGFRVISPHETFHYPTQPGDSKWMELLKHDMGSLLKCDGIVLLAGWSRSKGARLELSTAITLGMPVRFYKNGLLFDFS